MRTSGEASEIQGSSVVSRRIGIEVGRMMTTGQGRTCMTSRSCTYLRSVSTISLIILFRAASCAFAGTGTEGVVAVSDSVESSGMGGEGGATSVKTLSGSASRRMVMVWII